MEGTCLVPRQLSDLAFSRLGGMFLVSFFVCSLGLVLPIHMPEANVLILGKTEEVIKVLKEKRIDKEDPLSIIRAVNEFQSEKECSSYHLASQNSAGDTIPLGAQV